MGQEGDSNSPRDNVTILNIETRGAGRERVKIKVSDGSSFIMLREILEGAGLAESQELSCSRLRELLDQSDIREAERFALDLLTRASHSRERLRLKLIKKGFAPSSVEHALGRMQDLGYLDDAKFAEEWLNLRIGRHPEGRQALLAGLVNHGIDPSLANRIVARVVTREVEKDCANRLLDKHNAFRSLPPERLAQRLSSRGFSSAVICQLLDELKESGA
jgi:regulatory protein